LLKQSLRAFAVCGGFCGGEEEKIGEHD